MIEVNGLTKVYGENMALNGVSFSVAKGEVIGFLGPNGAGKSTTMRIIAGSLGASAGSAKVGGFDVAEHPKKVQAILGYAPETPPVYGNMRVRDYIEFAATLKGVAQVSDAALRAMKMVGLEDVQSRIIENLSKGYRQRVGLAQALVHDPQVLILDEPTSGLDPAQRVEIRHLIQTLAEGDRTVVLSTHVLGEIEALCNRVMIINGGVLVTTDAQTQIAAPGRVVHVEVARPEDGFEATLRSLDGFRDLGRKGDAYVVRGERDLREDVARAALSYGLLELSGRERLEDIYLRLTARSSS